MKVVVMLVMIVLLNGCSGDSETANEEKESPRATDAVAEKMAQSITRPIDKAEVVKELSEERGAQLEQAAD